MTEGILQRLQASQHFRPSTPDEYFALQLARKLNDIDRVKQYCLVTSRTSIPQLVKAYGRIQDAPSQTSAGERLLREFQHI